jgi:hypothetical protein
MKSQAQNEMLLMAAAILIGVLALLVAARFIYPLLSKEYSTSKYAETIALYVNSFATVETGLAKVPMADPGFVVEVMYAKKGEPYAQGAVTGSTESRGFLSREFRFPENGWYVVVSYKSQGAEKVDASRIYVYPDEDSEELKTVIEKASEICIEKGKDSLTPKVREC